MAGTANPFLLPVSVSVAGSPLLIRLLYGGVAGAVLAIWLSAAWWPVKIGVSLAVLVYATVVLAEIRSEGPDDPAHIVLLHDDSWRVVTRSGETLPAELGKGVFVHYSLTLLPLYYAGCRKVVIFAPDYPDKAELRRLRVRLKYAC